MDSESDSKDTKLRVTKNNEQNRNHIVKNPNFEASFNQFPPIQ